MTSKLLHKTLFLYLGYSVVIVIVTSVAFYFFLQKLYTEEIYEHLQHEKTSLTQQLHSDTIVVSDWNKRNSLAQLIPANENNVEKSYRSLYYDQHEKEWVPYLVLDTPYSLSGKTYLLRLKANMLENEDLIESILLIFTILLLLLLGGIILLTQLISKKVWKPFFGTLQQIEAYKVDRPTALTLPTTSTVEFQRLNASVEQLVQQNSLIYQQQRQFIENAAHELQTPIAILSSQLNLLAQSSDLTEEQAVLIENMEIANQRFQHLNKNLLLLSKLDSEIGEQTTIHLSELVGKYVSLMLELFAYKQLDCHADIAPNVMIHAPLFAITSLIENLLSNAFKHNHEKGKIVIQLSSKQLIIRNTGIARSLDATQLFQRFTTQKTDASGSGLGLSIVHKIAEQLHWNIRYEFSDCQHIFILTLN